jgi:hypothetical protein
MECFNRDNLKRSIAYVCGIAFDFSKNGSFFSDKIYIEVESKKNAMYGEIGISKGYKFRLVTNEQYQFRFWSQSDTFAIETGKEGIEYKFTANSIDELIEKVIDSIYDILPQYK